MTEQVFWFATRGAGILCWFAAMASVVVGMMMSSRVLGRRPTIPWLLDFHRYLSSMSLVFLGIHLLTLWLDSYVDFTIVDLVVPGQAEAPGLTTMSMAWGVLAGWALVIVQLSSLIKKYLRPRLWHTLHLLSFGTLAAGAVHGLQTGTDVQNRVLLSVVASVLSAFTLVGVIRAWRALALRKHRYELALEEEAEAAAPADEPWDDGGASWDDPWAEPADVYWGDDRQLQDDFADRWEPAKPPPPVRRSARR